MKRYDTMPSDGNQSFPSVDHSKRTKITEGSQLPTTSSQDAKLPPMSQLPEELVTEILLRLPVKSLLQFRCVSKSWLSLISSREFAKAHVELAAKNKDLTNHRLILSFVHPDFNLRHCSLRSLLRDPLTCASDADYPMKSPHNSVWIVGSCNGLICLAIEEKDVFLWNPTIRMSKKLPDSGVKLKNGYYIIYGFGYDQTNDDYKVAGIFCVLSSDGLYESEVKVYSLKADSWRRIDDYGGGVLLNDSGKLVDGKLHWGVSSGHGLGWGIVSLDLAQETYGRLEQPCFEEGGFNSFLGVVRERLCILCDYDKVRADVWIMNEYGVKESWAKVITVPYLHDPRKYSYSLPVFLTENGKILLVFGSIFVVYDPKDNSHKYPQITNFDACLEAEIYVESLVLPISCV